ncbi:hypothetical protein NCCP691_19360 [Noviherbaspirillum aridicola]|uniref:AAA domain-containing protein n=2 Tax=Noviherbaspirillum aridicola TaxID=2849687 RepID=A0ABQ4Q4J0_9BURK|nr:hypothetical protein NCCP691_19360 [Noviherbaspirillum aridicola]
MHMAEPDLVLRGTATDRISHSPSGLTLPSPHGLPLQQEAPSPAFLAGPQFSPETHSGENPLIGYVPPVLPETELRARLRNRAVPQFENTDCLTPEQKVAALACLPMTYRANTEGARFAQRVIAQVRASLALRNPENPRYARFYYGQADVMHGGRLKPMPDYLGGLSGPGVILAGPSGSGKSALLHRLRFLVGLQPVRLHGKGIAPAEFIFLPMLTLRWPDCGTLAGLLANFRDALIAELGSSQTSEAVFANMTGRRGSSVAIATCIFLNLGLLVVDGMCLRSLRGEFREILDFLSTLKRHSGIPTILSCTYPALQVITRGGSTLANFGSGGHESWDLEPPGTSWEACCKSFWGLGLHDPSIPIPEYLPDLMWCVSRGNMRILTEAFNALHHANVYDPRLPITGTRSTVTDILDVRLRRFKEPLSVLASFQESLVVPRKEDLYAHGDYLPFEAFSDTPGAELARMFTARLPRGA